MCRYLFDDYNYFTNYEYECRCRKLLNELRNAIQVGQASDELLRSVKLSSLDELKRAFKDRKNDVLFGCVWHEDLRPLLFDVKDMNYLRDFQALFDGHVCHVEILRSVYLFVDRYGVGTPEFEAIGLRDPGDLVACVSRYGKRVTKALFKKRLIPFALGLSMQDGTLLASMFRQQPKDLLLDDSLFSRFLDCGFGPHLQDRLNLSDQRFDVLSRFYRQDIMPASLFLRYYQIDNLNENEGIALFADKVSLLLEGAFNRLPPTLVFGYAGLSPENREQVARFFHVEDLDKVQTVMCLMDSFARNYFWNLGDFSSCPDDPNLYPSFLEGLIDEGAYALIQRMGQLVRVLSSDNVRIDELCSALRWKKEEYARYVDALAILPRYYDDDTFCKYLKDRCSAKLLQDVLRWEAEAKNRRLSEQLDDKRENMCGVGTRRLKLFLNRLVKKGDVVAKGYRLALETEDVNIVAKRQVYPYKEKYYDKKQALLIELADFCEAQGWVYGCQSIQGHGVDAVIYFELPDMEQISFHTHISGFNRALPVYSKPWIGKEQHTLIAIEQAIMSRYGEAVQSLKKGGS